MPRKKKQPEAQTARQERPGIVEILAAEQEQAPHNQLLIDVTNKRPVVNLPPTAESLYGIKPDCADIPRLLRVILEELIRRGR